MTRVRPVLSSVWVDLRRILAQKILGRGCRLGFLLASDGLKVYLQRDFLLGRIVTRI